MAHTKAGGSTKLGRDSASKRLGVKINHGQNVKVGQVIVRQRGTHYVPGVNVKRAGDDTLVALKSGVVQFYKKVKIHFDGNKKKMTFVKVLTK
ncbi:MAG: 50S ribosomal protein L27 [Candidatus Liptonbacteria bacterium]|nr:50S ribosomal protein L27 [Candidatus Liptonbacteria bacterium]